MEATKTKISYLENSKFEQKHGSSYTVSCFLFVSNSHRKHCIAIYPVMKIHQPHLNLEEVAGNSQAAAMQALFYFFHYRPHKATSLDQLLGLIAMSSNFQGNFMQIKSPVFSNSSSVKHWQMILAFPILIYAFSDSSYF